MTAFFRCAVAAASLTLLPLAASAADFTKKQRAEIGQIVHDYLLANPELLVEVSKELDKRQKDAEDKQRNDAVARNADQIFRESIDLVAGNPKGDVTMVEFFDYNCAWCKKGLPTPGSWPWRRSAARYP